MTISARSMVFLAGFRRIRAWRWVFAAVGVAALAAPGPADAMRIRSVRAGAYDGIWNVVFATEAGNCSATNSVAVRGVRHAGFRRPAAAR